MQGTCLFPVNNLSNCIFRSLWGWIEEYFTQTTTYIIVNNIVYNSTKEDSSSSHLQLRQGDDETKSKERMQDTKCMFGRMRRRQIRARKI